MVESVVIKEIKFKATRSGGPGGQHANKVSSRVVAEFDLFGSMAFSEDEKHLIYEKLRHRLTQDGQLKLSCDSSRSQHQNKAIVIERMISLLRGALKKPRKRIPTRISKTAKMRRMKSNIKHSEKKASRRRPNID